jgi:hypothetical protein
MVQLIAMEAIDRDSIDLPRAREWSERCHQDPFLDAQRTKDPDIDPLTPIETPYPTIRRG